MLFLGCDNTFSAEDAKYSAEQAIKKMSPDELYILKHHQYYLFEEYKDSWLLPLFGQYNQKRISLEEAYYFYQILTWIRRKELYISLYDIENWAFPDSPTQTKNINNVIQAIPEIDITLRKKKNSDGLFFFKEETKLWCFDGKEESALEEYIETVPRGTVEFGTTTAGKSWFSLFQGYSFLLRVPYEIEMLEHPIAAILYRLPPSKITTHQDSIQTPKFMTL